MIAECPPPVISTLNRRKYKKNIKSDIYGLEVKCRYEKTNHRRIYQRDNTDELLKQKKMLYDELQKISAEQLKREEFRLED